ncbi:Serine/threonine-protein phosphatase PP1 [Tritrichomonas foetus]|uniref:Serine/threonine-protein phosphatase n=1 Tax=Tritrichomonas foetus TaxID=1144522 RepID=A0A1J4KMK6_9EUKA|nr:Serine/threonine-protein phosphatase PP1 [Tritrichomonas foetus]|eukprot:OHT10605.1 Serine/threonine-protein phosphatase PP1 [Tritrichomonas foetus]
MASPAFQVFSAYSFVYTLPEDLITSVGESIAIPSFDEDVLSRLCQQALKLFEKEEIVSEIDGDVIVVGDIHGSLHDLLRIINFCGQRTKVLFLGDYVDRGSYSVEVIALLLALKILYPDTFFLLRGNHEFDAMCSNYGFKDEVIKTNEYSDSLYDEFLHVFSYLPVAAIVNKSSFCIHGGLSPELKKISDIKRISRPVNNFDDCKLLSDIMWADPNTNNNQNFAENPRGRGTLFGGVEVVKFLKNNKLSRLIRAHECVQNGAQFLFGSKVITVFSASSYNYDMGNSSGLLNITEETNNVKEIVFEPLHRMPKEEAQYRQVAFRTERSASQAFLLSMASQKSLLIGSYSKSSDRNKMLKIASHFYTGNGKNQPISQPLPMLRNHSKLTII